MATSPTAQTTSVSSTVYRTVESDSDTCPSYSSDSSYSDDEEDLNRIGWDQFLRFEDTPARSKDKTKANGGTGRSKKRKPCQEKTDPKKKSPAKRVKPNEKEAAAPKRACNVRDDLWNQRYGELKAYAAANGDCRVSGRSHENPSLGCWVMHQRALYKNNQLLPDRQQKLETLGFVWDANNMKEEAWNQKYEELKAYKSNFGDCLVPITYEDNPPLGLWVATQRQAYKKQLLQKDRKEQLQQLGFVWDANNMKEEAWNQKYEELKAYKSTFGDCRVPCRYPDNPPLGKWVATQRQAYKKQLLRKDRKEQLQQLGFVWDANNINKEEWNQKYEELKAYKSHFGDCLVPTMYEDNPPLGRWVSRQRHYYKNQRLWKDRKEQLQQLGFVWDDVGNETKWNQRFQELKAYKAINGDCLVPKTYKANPGLGSWVGHQRYVYNKNKLPKSRIRRLEQLKFVWKIK